MVTQDNGVLAVLGTGAVDEFLVVQIQHLCIINEGQPDPFHDIGNLHRFVMNQQRHGDQPCC